MYKIVKSWKTIINKMIILWETRAQKLQVIYYPGYIHNINTNNLIS